MNNLVEKYIGEAKKLSDKEKMKKYKEGKYAFNVPPVSTARWDAKAWIKWIDASGEWK
jgi:hypothetical protein